MLYIAPRKYSGGSGEHWHFSHEMNAWTVVQVGLIFYVLAYGRPSHGVPLIPCIGLESMISCRHAEQAIFKWKVWIAGPRKKWYHVILKNNEWNEYFKCAIVHSFLLCLGSLNLTPYRVWCVDISWSAELDFAHGGKGSWQTKWDFQTVDWECTVNWNWKVLALQQNPMNGIPYQGQVGVWYNLFLNCINLKQLTE